MNIFAKATRIGLRVQTPNGPLSTEQLWTLTPAKLADVIRAIKKQLNTTQDQDLAFLDANATQVDEEKQLAFDVCKEIYTTKKAESDERLAAAERKEQRAKIAAILAAREEEALGSKSTEELERLLAEMK